MFTIGYHSHITTNAKIYREAVQQIRQWAYAHAGNRRSQATKHFAGGAKARNRNWQADGVTIQIRQLRNFATVISVQSSNTGGYAAYHAQAFAYSTGWEQSVAGSPTEPKQYALATIATQELDFNPPWGDHEAGAHPLELIVDRARETDRPTGGHPQRITSVPQPTFPPGTLFITEAADLRQETVPILAMPESASATLRQALENESGWCDVGYADPAATILIARSLPDPETAARWLNAELVTVVDETAEISNLPTESIHTALAELRQQYENSRIFQTVHGIATFAEMLAHNVNF